MQYTLLLIYFKVFYLFNLVLNITPIVVKFIENIFLLYFLVRFDFELFLFDFQT